MSSTRTPGLRGRLPELVGDARLPIQWVHEYLTDLPAPTYPIDVSEGITDWLMLGNGPDPTLTVNGGNPVGDCYFAALEHDRMLSGHLPTADEAVDLYFAYGKSQGEPGLNPDQGVNVATALAWCHKQGIILAFAPVHPDTVDAVMAHFGRGIITGVSLTDDADPRFEKHEAWTVADGERPDPREGHCILRIKVANPTGRRTYVTWGADQDAEEGWEDECAEEYWLILTEDDKSQMGDQAFAALLSDLAGI